MKKIISLILFVCLFANIAHITFATSEPKVFISGNQINNGSTHLFTTNSVTLSVEGQGELYYNDGSEHFIGNNTGSFTINSPGASVSIYSSVNGEKSDMFYLNCWYTTYGTTSTLYVVCGIIVQKINDISVEKYAISYDEGIWDYGINTDELLNKYADNDALKNGNNSIEGVGIVKVTKNGITDGLYRCDKKTECTINDGIIQDTNNGRNLFTDYTWDTSTLNDFIARSYWITGVKLTMDTVTPTPTLEMTPTGTITPTITPAAETTSIPTGINPNGAIVFEPNSTAAFPNGWANKDVPVKVYLKNSSDRENIQYGTQKRTYKYTIYFGTTPYASSKSKNTSFQQSFNVNGKIDVSSNLINPNSSTVNENNNVMVSNEGTGVIYGNLNGWKEGDKKWVEPTTKPPKGSWKAATPTISAQKPTNLYNSNSGQYKIDKTRPYNVTFVWDNQVVNVGSKYEYICDSSNNITITVGDNLSGIEEVRKLWTQDNIQPDKNSMTTIPGLNTKEGVNETKNFTINLHDNKTNYNDLRKGDWYLHIYQKDRAGNETHTVSPPIKINKAENLRISTIYDFDWKYYFVNEDNSQTALSQNGIKTPDMAVFTNKEAKYIKLGYGVDLKIDTIGFNNTGDRIDIKTKFYALDNQNTIHEADIYMPDNNGNYFKLDSSNTDLTLGDEKRGNYESNPSLDGYNTWKWNYYIPYSAKIVDKAQTLDLQYDNTYKNKLIVVFDITAVKTDGRKLNYTVKENNWSTSNGSLYGKSFPTGANLFGNGINRGEVFWYDLSSTALDDINMNRQW